MLISENCQHIGIKFVIVLFWLTKTDLKCCVESNELHKNAKHLFIELLLHKCSLCSFHLNKPDPDAGPPLVPISINSVSVPRDAPKRFKSFGYGPASMTS